MDPEKLISTIDFRYITDVITKEEALEILKKAQEGKEDRQKKLLEVGYPAYTTQVGWIGYSNEQVAELCQKYLNLGYTAFKVKVGNDIKEDINRLQTVRSIIGWDNLLVRIFSIICSN